MNEVKQTTIRLTAKHSAIFFLFIWAFSGGVYLWVNNSLGEGYVNRINNSIERQNSTPLRQVEISDNAAAIATDITLDRLRNILILVNAVALAAIPLIAYRISKQTLLPLVESQKSQRRFIANASHELRTPLAVMLADLDWAKKKQRSLGEYQSTLSSTREEVLHMSNLVHSLLLLARLSAEAPNHMNALNITTIIDGEIKKKLTLAQLKTARIKFQLDNATVKGNGDLLAVAVGNLIDNAIKYSPDHSTVNIGLTAMGKSSLFSVSNLTNEITQKDLNRLFDRFYQAESHQGGEGFGLGLALAKQIIDFHHGEISASLSDGRLTITVRLQA